jgi:hypothetical protein
MKRFLILFMVLGLVAGSVATAEAAKKTKKPTRIERTVEGSYGPPYVPPVTGCKSLLGPWACLIIATHSTEAFFTAKVTDAHGQPVFVWYSDHEGTSGIFCGETTRPVSFAPGSEIEFRLGIDWPGQLECAPHKIKTIGTISVTLSNLP